MSLMSPTYLPTIIPPKPWTGPKYGGYYSPLAHRIRFTITGKGRQLPQEVYDAVNAVQETPWKVNRRILDVLSALLDTGGACVGLPPAEPAKPDPLTEGLTDEQMKAWKLKAKVIYRANVKSTSRRMEVLDTLNVAHKMAEYERLYFPHRLDFRGRAYPIPLFLNPQGTDYVKAFLTFADGVAIHDERAAGWLAIHGANTYAGQGRVGRPHPVGRGQRAHDPSRRHRSARRGLPLLERPLRRQPVVLPGVVLRVDRVPRPGYGYLSSLPVAMDGSCNGYPALLGCPAGRGRRPGGEPPALRHRPARRHLPDRRGEGHRLPQ